MACNLQEIFHQYKRQPIEIITKSGMKYCGTIITSDEESIEILDCHGRTVHLGNCHIEAVIKPHMHLIPVLKKTNCCCDEQETFNK